MKVSEFRQLIREEVRKVLIEDQSSLPTLEDARPKGSYFSIIAIKDKVVGDSKDIIITKKDRDKLKAQGYSPIGIGAGFNASATSIEYLQDRIDELEKNKNYTIRPDDLKLWKSNPVEAYKKEGISYRHTGPENTRDDNGYSGTIGGREFRPTPLYMSANGMNITGADNGKLIGFLFGMTQKTLIAVK